MQIQIKAYGTEEASSVLFGIAARANDLGPILDTLHDRFRDMESRQFSGQGVYSGKWAPDKPKTIARKVKRGQDIRILHATRRLRRSLTDKRNADHVFEFTNDKMAIGTRVPYARFHQEGTKKMPQREVVVFTDHERTVWREDIAAYIMKGEA